MLLSKIVTVPVPYRKRIGTITVYLSLLSVGDPDPDPHVFGPPGSACFWASWIRIHKSQVRIRLFPFAHKGVERTEIMPAKLNFNTKF